MPKNSSSSLCDDLTRHLRSLPCPRPPFRHHVVWSDHSRQTQAPKPCARGLRLPNSRHPPPHPFPPGFVRWCACDFGPREGRGGKWTGLSPETNNSGRRLPGGWASLLLGDVVPARRGVLRPRSRARAPPRPLRGKMPTARQGSRWARRDSGSTSTVRADLAASVLFNEGLNSAFPSLFSLKRLQFVEKPTLVGRHTTSFIKS